jgi:hypothetical protein
MDTVPVIREAGETHSDPLDAISDARAPNGDLVGEAGSPAVTVS